MKDYSSFLGEKPFSCNVDGSSMKFSNEDNLVVNKRKHDMILNLGLGQKGTTYSDQTPTPTQFIRNCEEVGLFQDLQNVNPFEETFRKAVEAVKSGQLSLEKSFQSASSDDTLHTPNVFPHITDVTSITHSDISNKSVNTQHCEDDLLKQDAAETDKNCSTNITALQTITSTGLSHGKKESAIPWSSAENPETKSENKVILNVPEGHLVQLLTPPNDSCNMVVIKNEDLFSCGQLTVKEKLKKSLSDKKTGRNMLHKVPILKCPLKKSSSSLTSKFSKFSKNAMKLISKLENSEVTEVKKTTSIRQKKITKDQSKESRSEFLARSRAASSRCREKKKMYLLYLEKVNSELSTANQNLLLINTLLRQELDELHRELQKHKNCNAADKSTEAALRMAENFICKKKLENEKPLEILIQPVDRKESEIQVDFKEEFHPSENELIVDEGTECQTDDSLLSLDVAEVILNDEPEENDIPLSEGNKPPDIIVRFNSVGNDFPAAAIPSDSNLDCYIERAGHKAKQIYGEHSYYLKKSVDVDKRFMNYKTYREAIDTSPEVCKELNALQMKQNDAFRDLTSLNSKVLIGPRTPPPLILLKPFKKRTLQSKRNEKT